MRIACLTDVNDQPVYVDAEQFVGISVHEGVTWAAFAHEFLVRTKFTPMAVLQILGLEPYVQGSEPEPELDNTMAARDRMAIEKTRTGPMSTGELKAPESPKAEP